MTCPKNPFSWKPSPTTSCNKLQSLLYLDRPYKCCSVLLLTPMLRCRIHFFCRDIKYIYLLDPWEQTVCKTESAEIEIEFDKNFVATSRLLQPHSSLSPL